MIDNLRLIDFDNLYVIAIGVNMAYIVVRGRRKRGSFFNVLFNVSYVVKNLWENIKSKEQKKNGEVITQIEFYINNNSLIPQTAETLMSVSKMSDGVLETIDNFSIWLKKKQKQYTTTNYLNVLSCDCFLLGMIILLVEVFQISYSDVVDNIMFSLLATITVLMLHCLSFEKFHNKGWTRWLKPTIIFHCIIIIFAIFFVFVFFSTGSSISPITSGWICILSIVGCYLGFISYLIRNIIVNFVVFFIFMLMLFSWNVVRLVQKDIISKHRDELNNIDEQIKKESLNKYILAQILKQNMTMG